jgi:cobalt-zinc-cadmium efflux system protein
MSEHNHIHFPEISDINQALVFGSILNIAFVIIEVGSGFYFNSLALLSDAVHNLTDVVSLLLALLAFRLAKVKPNFKYTYGFRKTTILVSLLNSVFLLVTVGGILWESIGRFQSPESTSGASIASVAGIGIFINGFTAYLFLKDKNKDLNIKGVYLHMASDTLVSIGVFVAGIAIEFTNWFWLDGVISTIIALIILFSTFHLLKDSFNLSIDAVPEGITVLEIKNEIEEVQGVLEVHHIHIWAISTTLNSLTAHIKIKKNLENKQVIKIKSDLREKFFQHNIQHSTLEFEFEEEICENQLI